ncbi:Hsp33 family molecular chaperone HslO [Tepidicella baoligensis]|uniref:Hsp33 family molecular chaperone HslO n=1 Tax=Tepidicella baoligensis TaxID=2707016 RepID=UPI0015DA7AD5
MSELHKFLFKDLPVRGMLVRLTDGWQELLRRHAQSGGYPRPVSDLLGEMLAAAVLMQGNIKFNGSLVLQVFGDGPVKVAVAEVQPDFTFRATATVLGEVADGVPLSHMVNVNNQGRCAITLDPKDRMPGQQPYQGVVPLFGSRHEKLERMSDVLEHYMLQSEQLDTRLVLAANEHIAAGLLIQRIPTTGEANLSGTAAAQAREDAIGRNEDYNRIATLAASLKREELLTLDADTILHRLFWQEPIQRFEPPEGVLRPRFGCTCSRERVAAMLESLGVAEVEGILAEQGQVEIGCEFCGARYVFDPVDAAQIFLSRQDQPPASSQVQ